MPAHSISGRDLVAGVGGSTSTDGGLGAVEALRERAPFPVPVRVAWDVQTPFLEAASVFGPQKGATAAQVSTLTARLERLAARYEQEFGVDVCSLPGAGAAGGLAGGLAALGASLVPGFDLVASEVGLDDALLGVDLIVTGEGRLDSTSFDGKVVGEIVDRGQRRGVDVLIVAGDIDRPFLELPSAASLVERFGRV